MQHKTSKASSRFIQLSHWQVILHCPTSSNMDHHGMCVFCEDMQNGYTSSAIKICFLNLLFFYPLPVFPLLASRSFCKFSLHQSFFIDQVKTFDQLKRPVVANGRDGFVACCDAFPPVPTQSGVPSCWVEQKNVAAGRWLTRELPGVTTH